MKKTTDPLTEMNKKFEEKLKEERKAFAVWHQVNKPAIVIKMHSSKKQSA
jgi:hypothetical protein